MSVALFEGFFPKLRRLQIFLLHVSPTSLSLVSWGREWPLGQALLLPSRVYLRRATCALLFLSSALSNFYAPATQATYPEEGWGGGTRLSFIREFQTLVSYAAVLRVVTQRSSPALRDDPQGRLYGVIR